MSDVIADTLLDYSHPDVVWGRRPPKSIYGVNAVVFQIDERLFVVHAKRGYSNVSIYTRGPTWECSQPYTYTWPSSWVSKTTCDYNPGPEDGPPLPGQHCYQCKQLRAEWFELPDRKCKHKEYRDYCFECKATLKEFFSKDVDAATSAQ